ncbi:MAG: hypothetical protein AAFX85_09090 [Pseudomonadota bacterium]
MSRPWGGLPARHDFATPLGGLASGDVRGDRDNFGFGVNFGVPPCNFFNNLEPEDLRVFDYERGVSDQIKQWDHEFEVLGVPTAVLLLINEIFSDDGLSAFISLDGKGIRVANNNFSECFAYPPGGTTRLYLLLGDDASIAADGAVTVRMAENGDNIALEWSVLSVQFE